jgi:FdrA protein
MVVLHEIREGFYLDSVALMRLSREVSAAPDVIEAALMMGTPSNAAIMRNSGLLEEGVTVKGNDLIVAVKAKTKTAAREALDRALKALDKPKAQGETHTAWRPHTIAAAVKHRPDVNLALISVPGEFAAAEGRKALNRGLHVMMFSDNVSLEDELSLKQQAREAGLLMMGPDCGTAVIDGAPLAFANKLRRGSVGVIGASGTGTQEVTCLISEAGEGISHAIGVGGRDLKKEIGGITTLMAIDALDADSKTNHIVLISKPPHPDVARAVIERIARSKKTFTVCFVGAAEVELPSNARFSPTLKSAAELALGGRNIGASFDVRAQALASGLTNTRRRGRIEGLFAGGTLCAEAQVVLIAAGRKVVSNAGIPGVQRLENASEEYDRVIDLGDDEYTLGRPHPMIDPSVRDSVLRAAIAHPGTSVVLLDVVLGYGAHADPAEHLVRVVADRPKNGPALVLSVVGTDSDPQVRSTQVRKLAQAGVLVAPSNAHACELAAAIANNARG